MRARRLFSRSILPRRPYRAPNAPRADLAPASAVPEAMSPAATPDGPWANGFTGAQWCTLALGLSRPDVTTAHVADLCEVLIRCEWRHLLQTRTWRMVAPDQVYASLQDLRARLDPLRWAREVAGPLCERMLPEGSTLRDLMVSQFLPTAAHATAPEVEAAAAVYFVHLWMAHRAGGPPDPTLFTLDALRASLWSDAEARG